MLHLPQKHKATVPDSTLRVEMKALEEQADNVKACERHWKPLSWLGTIRPTTPNDDWDQLLWETFVCTTLGLEVPVLTTLPRCNQRASALCGCKKRSTDLAQTRTTTTRPPVRTTVVQPKSTTGRSEFWALSSSPLGMSSALSIK
jgi:hypothetical protein